jgi:hypothetical protein
MHTFRIYDCVLQDGELEIIKNQQGQILWYVFIKII